MNTRTALRLSPEAAVLVLATALLTGPPVPAAHAQDSEPAPGEILSPPAPAPAEAPVLPREEVDPGWDGWEGRAPDYVEIPTIYNTTESARRWGEGGLGPKPPHRMMTPEEEQQLIECQRVVEEIRGRERVPMDPEHDRFIIEPRGPESVLNSVGNGLRGPITFYRDENLTDAETGNPSNWPREPSLGTFGRVVLYCGNTFASLSTDGGLTYTFINPNVEFPAGICCDQVIYYDRRHQMIIWLMQHSSSGNENIYRIALAVGQENIANRNWFWYDLDPQNYGHPAGTWWDFPELTVSNNYMWFTTNGQSGDSDAIMVRAELDDLRNAGSTTFSWAHMTTRQIRLIQGASTVMYGAGHVDSNTMRVYRWAETGSLDGVNRDIDPWNNGNSSAPGPDGRDWFSATENSTHKVRGATATPSTTYFFWSDSQGGGYPFPYTRAAKFTRNDARTYVNTEAVWSSTTAWAYAAGHANDRGHLGGVIAVGGGSTLYPSSAAWIADDQNGVTIQPLENATIALGTNGPTGDRWGDYLTSRRHVQYGNTWVGAAFTLQGGPNTTQDVPTYTWFGRSEDTPPSASTIYVDVTQTDTWEDSTPTHPFNTVREGHFFAEDSDVMVVRVGTYGESLTLSTPMTIFNEGGIAYIGPGAAPNRQEDPAEEEDIN